MSNELTAIQLLQFIRTINRLSRDDVRIAFQEWIANPLKDSVELYISNDYGHEHWNDQIKEYLESLGFSIDIEYDDNYESGMTITISVNYNTVSNTNTSLLEEVRKLSKDSIYTLYESSINGITEDIRRAASKSLNHVLCSSVPNEVVNYFKDQGFTITYSGFDKVKFEW